MSKQVIVTTAKIIGIICTLIVLFFLWAGSVTLIINKITQQLESTMSKQHYVLFQQEVTTNKLINKKKCL